jgi:hypothetical protein
MQNWRNDMQKWTVLATPVNEEMIAVSTDEKEDKIIKVYQEFIIETDKLLGYFFIGDMKYKVAKVKKIK